MKERNGGFEACSLNIYVHTAQCGIFSNIHGASAAETSKFDSSFYNHIIELVKLLNILTEFARLK